MSDVMVLVVFLSAPLECDGLSPSPGETIVLAVPGNGGSAHPDRSVAQRSRL